MEILRAVPAKHRLMIMLFDRVADNNLPVRRINITAEQEALRAQSEQEKRALVCEKRTQQALLTIRKRFEENAILSCPLLLYG